MTLVVARLVGSKVCVVADTLVSGGKQDLRSDDLALKILCVDPRTTIAYAGSPEVAHGLIRNGLAAWNHLEVAQLTEDLRRQVGDSQLDFIVIQNTDIALIKDGVVHTGVSNAWIGDYTAFSDFQKALAQRCANRPRTPPEVSGIETVSWLEMADLRSAMADVSANVFLETVGGPIVTALSDGDGASYACLMELHSPLSQPKLVQSDSEGWTAIDFGDAARGGYGFTTLTPIERGIAGWGIYYFQAFSGMYLSADFGSFQFVRFEGKAHSVENFCNALSAEIGYAVQHCGQLGQTPVTV